MIIATIGLFALTLKDYLLTKAIVCNIHFLLILVHICLASSVLPQIQDLPLEINDTTVLQTEKDNREVELVQIERDMWKTKLDEINKWEPGVTKEEVFTLYALKCCCT